MTSSGHHENQDAGLSELQKWPGDQLLQTNLDALARQNPALAETIAHTPIPNNANLVQARDECVTYRFTQEDGRRPWLGGCSTPRIAAESLGRRTTQRRGNLILQHIGHGMEVVELLKKLDPHEAIFVYETEPAHLAMALRLRDFSPALERGQLVLLRGDDLAETLAAFFADHPGYDLTREVVKSLSLTPQQTQQFSHEVTQAMEIVNNQSNALCQEKWKQLGAHYQSERLEQTCRHLHNQEFSSLKAVNFITSITTTSYCMSRDSLAALQQLGMQTDWQVPDRPDKTSLAAQLERLLQIQPDLIVLVDVFRCHLPIRLPESLMCVTLLYEPTVHALSVQPNTLGPHDYVCPTRQEHLEQLKQHAAIADRILPLSPAVYIPTKSIAPTSTIDDLPRAPGQVAIVAARQPRDLEHYQVRLETHRCLCEQVAVDIAYEPHLYESERINKILSHAQRCGVTLTKEDVREHFANLIASALGPTVVLDTYIEALIKAKLDVRIWAPAAPLTEPTTHCPPSWEDSPAAAQVQGSVGPDWYWSGGISSTPIHVHIDTTGRITYDLLAKIATGAFVLVRSHRNDRQPDGLGKAFELGRELITFSKCSDLVSKVEYYLAHPDKRAAIVQAGQQKLRDKFSMTRIMQHLLDQISAKENPRDN